jgi:hypothetical protein
LDFWRRKKNLTPKHRNTNIMTEPIQLTCKKAFDKETSHRLTVKGKHHLLFAVILADY